MAYNSFPYLSNNYNFISLALLIIFSILCNYIIDFNIKNKNIKLIIKAGILLRILIIISDNYFQIISFGGADGRVFHRNGWLGLNNFQYWDIAFIKLIMVPSYKLLGEAVPIFVVLLNLLAYTLAIVFLYKSMNLIDFKERARKKLIFLLISFSLISAMLNVSLLREGVMLFFTTISIYFYLKRGRLNILLSILSIFISTYLHSGMIFILFGYLYNYIMRQKGRKKLWYIALGTILLIIMLFIITSLPYFKGQNLEKLSKKSIEDAGSRYASEVNGPIEYVLSSPIRLFYFLFSPTPNMFRGFKDIISFLLNSCVYLYFIIDSIRNYRFIKRKVSRKEKIFIQSLFISFFVTAFAYGMGTIAAGTAIRHRDKLLFLLALINFYTYSKNKKRISKKRGDKRYVSL